MPPRALTAQVDVENFVLIAHAIPADRVRTLLPGWTRLQTFEDDESRETTLIAAGCFCNRQLRPTVAPWPRHTFNQATFRTFIDAGDDRPAAFFFGSYVDTHLSYAIQALVTRPTRLADFDIYVEESAHGYRLYEADITAGNQVFSFSLSAEEVVAPKHPFATGEELSGFITHRLNGYSKNPAAGHTLGPVDHPVMQPFAGTLDRLRCDFWVELGLATEEELQAPFAVLVQPRVRFTLMPPRPARLGKR
jgi:Uncharacterized conserved protein (COG2071)